ncbi:MAG: sigma-70 family RNA polymerase sigma factor [Gemmataceae bacterium]|nr:sigma-70 family RNA polymerase sigma factor [Gemmataceae bacterium]
MDNENMDAHLSQIQTLWTLVRQAHDESARAANQAQKQLIDRYGGAVKRYLLGALRDAEAADDLFQEFAYRLLHGDMKGADPDRGRFRYFVKGVLFHLVADHHKKQKRKPQSLHPDAPEPAAVEASVADQDREFLASWRDEILSRSWTALEEEEKKSGKPFYTVLRFRVEHAKMPSAKMADELGAKLGKPVTAAGVRQSLHRARERFADLVLDEVIQSLDNPKADQLEQELIDLGLMEYCRPALERRE